MLECSVIAPSLLCQHREALFNIMLYLAPSAGLALLIQRLSARYPFFLLFRLAGTVCHELAHFGVGLVTYARPASFTVIPRRVGKGWQLGSVSLTRVRWYNAAPAALAPFLVGTLPFLVALWRTHPGWRFETLDMLLAFAVAPQFLACWPSAEDWKISLRSWPYLLIVGTGWCALHYWRF